MNGEGETRAFRNYRVGATVPGVNVKVWKEGEEMHAKAFPDIPSDGLDIWLAFWKLSRLRSERAPIMPNVIIDWCQLHGKKIIPLVAGTLERMDQQFLKTLGEEIAFNSET